MEASSDRPTISTDLGTRATTCESHGTFEATGMRLPRGREIWSQCPICQGERDAADRRAEAERKATAERERLEAMLRSSGIPARLMDCRFGNYVAKTNGQKAALEVAMNYARDFEQHLRSGESLIFHGKPGTGKGHLAAAIMHSVMPARLPIYTTCLDMIRSVRDTWRKDSKFSELQVLQEYEDAALLIIDEVGVQYGTDGERTVIFDVLDRRYRQMRPSILITNQELKELEQGIGERSFDRLRETAKRVAFDWASYRPTARRDSAS